jgi:tetratricopeptide (TPR) repeat protein
MKSCSRQNELKKFTKPMRKTTIVISSCIVLLMLGYTGYRGYKVWKQDHWLKMASGFAAKGDARSELLCLRQALNLNPHNSEACRLMADLADATHSDAALIWRQRLVDLNPGSLPERLALAQTAMSIRDFGVASNALASVSEAGQKTAVYQNAAGLLASGAGQTAAAKARFLDAIKLDPDNFIPQLNLAALQLHGSNLVEVVEARGNLQRISQTATNLTIANQAKRELVMDAIRFNDFSTAEMLAKNLAGQASATFSDQLLRLDVLQKEKSPEFRTVLVAYQREASASPTKLSNMAIWLMHNTSPAETLSWLQSLPQGIRTNQPAAPLLAECQLRMGDWHQLQANIQNQNWNELEFVRHAFLARALQGQALKDAAVAEWGVALNVANDQKGAMISLFRMAAAWQWRSETEELLWVLVNRYPEEHWAPPVLIETLMNGGRTRPLMQLFGLLSRRNPDDMELKNDLAFTALLLGAQEQNPAELAHQAYVSSPKNPAYASTYAYSLYLQKQYAEAQKVMEQLTPQELGTPSVAGYYGIALKATGNLEKAKVYLRLTNKVRLLPEEQALFQQALIN